MNKRAVGSEKESIIADYLSDNGYTIIERNFFSRSGEVDIIALKDKYICFVEVKYRKNKTCGMPQEAVSLNKMKKICKASMYYLYTHRQYASYQIRYDVAAILAEDITYYENAFCYVE